ncbi:hypothetical protein ACRRTK_020516 [Alexandromys fortis]
MCVCIELLSSCLHFFPDVALSYYAATTLSRTFLLLQSYLVWFCLCRGTQEFSVAF